MKATFLGALAAQASMAVAQMATYKPSQDSGLSYTVNIPSVSASSGSGDIYMQIKGPVSGTGGHSWMAIGQGTGMSGANIFIVYPNAAGTNVTLSPRLGQGFFEPDYNSAAKAELIGGTGIENGMLTANIKCSNCNSWSGGSMSFTDKSSSWIWSSYQGAEMKSDSNSADLMMHTERGTFNFDLTTATGGSSSNPFMTSAATSAGTASTTSSPPATSGAASNGAASSTSSALSMLPPIVKAHAAVMSLSFLFFYPLGAIIMRVGLGRNTVWIHAGLQAFAYLLAIAGMGLGIWLALTLNYLRTPHAIIGLVVVSLLVIQAPLGLLHHKLYKKRGDRTVISHVHIWLGRALITLGAINGGLGLQLASRATNNRAGTIAYGVLAGVIYIGYFALIAATFGKGKKNAASFEEKRSRSSNAS